MILSSKVQNQIIHTSANAQIKAWEQLLSIRISLQKMSDTINRFPTVDNLNMLLEADEAVRESTTELSNGFGQILSEFANILDSQINENTQDSTNNSSSRKRKDSSSTTPSWEYIDSLQSLSQSRWEKVVNIHHSRMHFGSEQAKSRLKVFNQSVWGQIDTILSEPTRVIQKSRMPENDTNPRRLGGTGARTNDSDGNNGYDLETYDDRQFYSMLLKTFVASSTRNSLSHDELQSALRQQRGVKSKSNADRKASKGRKIRYIPHKKLENYMFPLPVVENSVDTDRLFSSLFQ